MHLRRRQRMQTVWKGNKKWAREQAGESVLQPSSRSHSSTKPHFVAGVYFQQQMSQKNLQVMDAGQIHDMFSHDSLLCGEIFCWLLNFFDVMLQIIC